MNVWFGTAAKLTLGALGDPLSKLIWKSSFVGKMLVKLSHLLLNTLHFL